MPDRLRADSPKKPTRMTAPGEAEGPRGRFHVVGGGGRARREPPPRLLGAKPLRGLVFATTCALVACSRTAPETTPEGAVRTFVDKMETSTEDARARREAYPLLGPHARALLKERADRASRGQGRRFEPWEMLAEGRFGLRFRPKAMRARTTGGDALVDVDGEGPEDHATVHCVRENGLWRVEPDLPEPAAPPRRADP